MPETYRPPSLRLLLLVLLAGVFIAALTAVLSADPKRPTSASGAMLPLALISDGEIQKEKPRSPRRVVLEWGQAVQFSDVDAATQFSSTAAIEGIGGQGELADAVKAVGPTMGRLSILGLRMKGSGKATVRAALQNFDTDGRRLSSAATTFQMTKTGIQWQVDDLALLEQLAREAETKTTGAGQTTP